MTDGTLAGTHMVKDIMPGSTTSLGSPSRFSKVSIFKEEPTFGPGRDQWHAVVGERWYRAGTTQFAEVNEQDETGAISLEWSKNEDHFIITTPDGVLASDGATTELMHPATTVFVKIPGLTYSVSPEGWMYFIVSQNGARLYRTKGTTATTEAVLMPACLIRPTHI